MDTKFNYTAAETPATVVFEQVFAEKPGGGTLANQTYDVKEGTAVALVNGKYAPIKGYRLVKAVAPGDTTIEIAKGSGIATGDVIGKGVKSVACTEVDKTNATKDVVTVTLGITIPVGTVLYQSGAASASAATPIYTPSFVLGETVTGNEGDKLVKLVNGANLRKETAPIATEVVALLNNINLV